MIDLTDTAAIYARAREAYANGELQAQTGAGPGFCSYKGPCAIGVYMTPEERDLAEPLYAAEDIENIIMNGLADGDITPLRQLQETHDEWNNMARDSETYAAEDIKLAEQAFVEQLSQF